MQRSIEILEMQESDLDGVMKIEKRAFKHPWLRMFFHSDIKKLNAYCWVAKEGGKLLGYFVAYHNSDELHIANIAVVEEERRRGIGSIFVKRAIALTSSLKIVRIYLEVRPTNISAINFYKKLGFEITNTHSHYYQDGEDALIMEKIVG